MKTYAGKNILNMLKVKLLKVLGCRIRQSHIKINICFCHCVILAYISIRTAELLHEKV